MSVFSRGRELFLLLLLCIFFPGNSLAQVTGEDTVYSGEKMKIPEDPTQLVGFLSKRAIRYQRDEDFIFRGVKVVFRKRNRWKIKRNRCVRVSEGRIVKMRHRWLWMPRRGALRLRDVRKKYLAPGLIDMHVHYTCDNLFRLAMLRFGVTTVRNMELSPYHTNERIMYKDRILLTPDVHCGLDLQSFTNLEKTDSDDPLTFEFIDGVISDRTYIGDGIVKAREKELGVALELPFEAPLKAFGDPAVKTFEGLNPFLSRTWPAGKPSEANLQFAKDIKDRWIVPCGVSTAGPWDTRNFINTYRSHFWGKVPPKLLEEWFFSFLPNEEGTRLLSGRLKTFHSDRMWILARLIKDEVPILAGSESGSHLPLVFPGFSLHEELRLFQGLGMGNARIMDAATVEAAKALEMEGEIGRVAKGSRADLVLLQDNPLKNIEHYRTIDAVMTNGFWLGSDELGWIKTCIKEDKAFKPRNAKTK